MLMQELRAIGKVIQKIPYTRAIFFFAGFIFMIGLNSKRCARPCVLRKTLSYKRSPETQLSSSMKIILNKLVKMFNLVSV